MERICSHCHAVLAEGVEADWCPACGGALLSRTALDPSATAEPRNGGRPGGARAEVDHRGIVLPRRHALGGIITPQ